RARGEPRALHGGASLGRCIPSLAYRPPFPTRREDRGRARDGRSAGSDVDVVEGAAVGRELVAERFDAALRRIGGVSRILNVCLELAAARLVLKVRKRGLEIRDGTLDVVEPRVQLVDSVHR